MTPVVTSVIDVDDTTPRIHLGTIASQDADNVDINGGSITGMTRNDATGVTLSDDTTTNATMYPVFGTAAGSSPLKISSTKFTWNPSTGLLSASSVSAQFNGTLGLAAPAAAAVTTFSASGQITSTLATGTAPFSVASTTVVPNLNVSQLLGQTWTVPGAIGSTTPNTGAFTTLTANQAVTLSPANANVVISPSGTGLVTINPATAGSMDNVTIGATTAKAGTFTQLSIGGQTTGAADFRTSTGATVVAGRTSNTGVGSQPGAYAVYAPNASGTVMIWSQARVSISNATAGSEACSLIFSTRVAGSFVDAATINGSGNLLVGTSTDGMTTNGSVAIAQDLAHRGTKAGFYNTSPVAKQTVTGSRGGNAALASLLTSLANTGLITDSTTA
jgi:hypothetical protein